MISCATEPLLSTQQYQKKKNQMNNLEKIICPTCKQKNTWRTENIFKPFCSDRCKLIDLGEWANESRKIPGAPVDPNSILAGNDPAHDFGDH